MFTKIKARKFFLNLDNFNFSASFKLYNKLFLCIPECEYGWEYDNSKFQSTIATSFNWFCERDYSTHILTVRFAGGAFGTVLLPALADRL